MRRTEIHLSEPFKEVLASLFTLPSTRTETDELHFPDAADSVLRKSARDDVEVKEALRSLYEAAHGRQVKTQIGFVPIAPPVAGFLKETPYYVATQCEFFLEAFTRILCWRFASQKPKEWCADARRQTRHEPARNRRRLQACTKRKRKGFPLRNIARIDEQPTNNAPMTNLPIHITTPRGSVSNALPRFA